MKTGALGFVLLILSGCTKDCAQAQDPEEDTVETEEGSHLTESTVTEEETDIDVTDGVDAAPEAPPQTSH
jgi:hypothetical protein